MMENRICIKCKEVIHPLRVKALPNTKTCVDCSTTGAKRGVPMMFGEKDHTWTDMVIMEPEEYDQFEKLNNQQPTFEVLDNCENIFRDLDSQNARFSLHIIFKSS